VVDALGLERFALFGVYHSSLVCIAYAARHPERVSHLALWCGLARAHDAEGSRLSPAMAALMDENYETFTETVAHQVFGWNEGDPAHRLAQYMHSAASPEIVKAAWTRDQTDSGMSCRSSCHALLPAAVSA
jgi:pimeloyl-ACP methyl ester carboxylesterase